jgi:hypothetical protein
MPVLGGGLSSAHDVEDGLCCLVAAGQVGEATLEVAAPAGLGLLGRAYGDEVDEALVGPVRLLVSAVFDLCP